jgi:Fe2+ or Zn2+ uptake regulation protein
LPDPDPGERFARLREACRERRLRMTPQREALLRVLSRAQHHVTADELYRGVRRLLPSVSAATVYRNVHQLVDASVIATLHRPGALHYDPNPDDHHHFICDVCGEVFDVYLTRVSYHVDSRRSTLGRARVEGCEVQLRGRCERCS